MRRALSFAILLAACGGGDPGLDHDVGPDAAATLDAARIGSGSGRPDARTEDAERARDAGRLDAGELPDSAAEGPDARTDAMASSRADASPLDAQTDGLMVDAAAPLDAVSAEAAIHDTGLPCVTVSSANCRTFGPPGPVCSSSPPLCIAAGYTILWTAETKSCVEVQAAGGSGALPNCIPISNPPPPFDIDTACLLPILTDTEAGVVNICYRLELVPDTGIGSFEDSGSP